MAKPQNNEQDIKTEKKLYLLKFCIHGLRRYKIQDMCSPSLIFHSWITDRLISVDSLHSLKKKTVWLMNVQYDAIVLLDLINLIYSKL